MAATRIEWGPHLREEIAKEIANNLRTCGLADSFTKHDMMRAFREIMPTVVPVDKQRNIQGPSHVPWLPELVEKALQQFPPESSQDDSLGIILDTLTQLESQLSESLRHQATQTTIIETLQRNVEQMGSEIVELRQIIIKKRQRALEKPKKIQEFSAPSPIQTNGSRYRVMVAGIEMGDQRELINKSMNGFPYPIDIRFDDANRGVKQIGWFDELIIMHWVPRQWVQKAQHTYPGKTHLATGIKNAIDLLHKIGRRCQK